MQEIVDQLYTYAYYSSAAYESFNFRELVKKKGVVVEKEKPNSDPLTPAYYIVIDNNTKQVIVIIRGTDDMDDMAVDACLANEPFDTHHGHHHGHQGIVIATWCLYDHMQKRLAEIMTTYGRKGYELVFTGHSLGGGCATLLSILLHPRYGAKCYGFGTPPCVTKELAEGKARMNDL